MRTTSERNPGKAAAAGPEPEQDLWQPGDIGGEADLQGGRRGEQQQGARRDALPARRLGRLYDGGWHDLEGDARPPARVLLLRLGILPHQHLVLVACTSHCSPEQHLRKHLAWSVLAWQSRQSSSPEGCTTLVGMALDVMRRLQRAFWLLCLKVLPHQHLVAYDAQASLEDLLDHTPFIYTDYAQLACEESRQCKTLVAVFLKVAQQVMLFSRCQLQQG